MSKANEILNLFEKKLSVYMVYGLENRSDPETGPMASDIGKYPIGIFLDKKEAEKFLSKTKDAKGIDKENMTQKEFDNLKSELA